MTKVNLLVNLGIRKEERAPPRSFEMRHGSLLDGWRAWCGLLALIQLITSSTPLQMVVTSSIITITGIDSLSWTSGMT